MIRRIKLTIAYDGTNYYGWQIQTNVITVEGLINKAIMNVTGEEICVIGASRTDRGVHARGNVAVFDTKCTIPIDKIATVINNQLPDDIVIVKAVEVNREFNPCYLNCIKTYEYVIWKNKIKDPFKSRYTCYHPYELDVGKMKEGLRYLIGEHDFASFCSAETYVHSTVRTIYSINIKETKDEIIFIFKGNGFLYHMIRIIMGVIMKIGDRYFDPIEIKNILNKRKRGYARPTAQASGLCLLKIEYNCITS